MRRFLVSPEKLKSEIVEMSGEEFHHLKNVTRLEEGELLELLDGEGHIAVGQIVAIKKKLAVIKLIERKTVEPPPLPHLILAVCIPKFQTMDLIVQKAAELGVQNLVPILSDRSFVRAKSDMLQHKIQRWEKISIETSKQCGRPWPMEVDSPLTLEELFKNTSENLCLFLYEGRADQNIKDVMSEWKPKNPRTEKIYLLIGAEGGFSQREVQLCLDKGLKPITLGASVLRVETACIAAVSVIKYDFDLMR